MAQQTQPTQVTIPPDFLKNRGPQPTVERIDFPAIDLPHYKGLYAVVIDNVLTTTECATLLSLAEQSSPKAGWERAMVNIGGGQQAIVSNARNCGRIIWDDHEMVSRIWDRIGHLEEVQEILRLEDAPKICGQWPGRKGEVWGFSRLNERMRFLRYVGGEYFRPHRDGTYETPDRSERSYFTLHLYLNGEDGKVDHRRKEKKQSGEEKFGGSLIGGATTFHDWKMDRSYDVYPKAGRILLFQHRDLLHSGDDVLRGVKYTMRTDLMYKLENPKVGKAKLERRRQ